MSPSLDPSDSYVGRPHRRASLSECNEHTDLAWRLDQIPLQASVRGVFLNMIDDRAGLLSEATQREYRSFFRVHRFTPFRFYPTRDYVTRLVVLAQIHWGGPSIYQGIREIQSHAFDAYASSLFGKAALALVEPSLTQMLRFIDVAWRTQTAVNYSRCQLVEATPTTHRIRFLNEFVYIEHAMVGALEGVARLTGTRITATVELETPFDGLVTLERQIPGYVS